MSVWLVDASVLLAAEDLDDVHHDAALRLLEGTDPLATLDLAAYEVTNVAIRAWNSPDAAARLAEVIAAIEGDRGVVAVSGALVAAAVRLAEEYGITVYDAAHVAAAGHLGARLVSCDVKDLVRNGLAVLPEDASRLADRGR